MLGVGATFFAAAVEGSAVATWSSAPEVPGLAPQELAAPGLEPQELAAPGLAPQELAAPAAALQDASFSPVSFLSCAAPQLPLAAQLAFVVLLSADGTSVACDVPCRAEQALTTVPVPITAKAIANLFILMSPFSWGVFAASWS